MSKTIKILTPDNIELEYKLASLGLRAAAAGIDLLIQALAVLIFAGIIIFFNRNSFWEEDTLFTVLGLVIIFSGFLSFGYYVVCDMVMKGQTPGKKVYRLRIIRENGEGITIVHAMIREFLKIALEGAGIGTIMIFFNQKNKRLGDLLASTIVVEEDKKDMSLLNAIYTSGNPYNLADEELELIKDYFMRNESLTEYSRGELRRKLTYYFEKKTGVPSNGSKYDEEYLKSLLG